VVVIDFNRNGSILFLAIIMSVTGAAQSQQHASTIAEGLFAAPVDGGLRRWQVATSRGFTLFDAPQGRELTAAHIEASSILRSFGCIESKKEIWCEVSPLHGGRRGFVLAEKLMAVTGPDGVVARGVDDSARRAKQKRYDATAKIQCAQEQGQELGICSVGVARSDGGDATVSATFRNGFSRHLFFAHGEFIRANSTMSGVGTDTEWHVENGVYVIRIDDQRYVVPESLVVKQ
jgi:hypothetical protein